MLSHQSKIDIISEIIHQHLKGKHKDKLAKELSEKILELIDDNTHIWYEND